MHLFQEFPAPAAEDYANVKALNAMFIDATQSLKGPQRGRLAVSPFLLFSLRETDVGWWDAALDQQRDLMDCEEQQNVGLRRLQIAALSFMWQLAKRNPYASRILSGASTDWCDRIAGVALVTLLDRVGRRADLLVSRLDDSTAHAAQLLTDGVCAERDLRHVAQLTVLQLLLTDCGPDTAGRLPAAACRLSGPLRLLDKKV